MAAIYLAGKIGFHCWRHSVVRCGVSFGDHEPAPESWPVLPKAVLGVFDYCGPFFIRDDHGCAHIGGTHAALLECCGYQDYSRRRWVVEQCKAAIRRSDIFFAWMDDLTAFGTLAELGFAAALGKRVVVALPHEPDDPENPDHGHDSHEPTAHPLDDLWFSIKLASQIIVRKTPAEALNFIADEFRYTFNSPIEEVFWRTHHRLRLLPLIGLKPQHPAGPYFIDFALPEQRFGIELDGYEYHSSRQQFTNDRRRQRELEMAGWTLIRFSGAEVNANVEQCVRQAAHLAQQDAMTASLDARR